ncbi:putative 17-beta-estradiol 17-dehydrogenase [Helianthus anomalus]
MIRSVTSSTSSRGIAAIVGVGPNLGRSIARKFALEGYTVAILARDLGRLSRFADEIARETKVQVYAIPIDCSEAQSVRDAFEGVLSLGFVEVLVYNAYQPIPWQYGGPSSFTDLRHDSFQRSLAVSSVGAFHCAQQVLPGMVERGRGTILFTGCAASLSGVAGFSELCCGKFALRGLSQCLAKEFHPLGVHIAHVIIDGIIGASRALMMPQRSLVGEQQRAVGDGSLDPDSVAQTYWYLHMQPRAAWTQEIDLRSPNPRFV